MMIYFEAFFNVEEVQIHGVLRNRREVGCQQCTSCLGLTPEEEWDSVRVAGIRKNAPLQFSLSLPLVYLHQSIAAMWLEHAPISGTKQVRLFTTVGLPIHSHCAFLVEEAPVLRGSPGSSLFACAACQRRFYAAATQGNLFGLPRVSKTVGELRHPVSLSSSGHLIVREDVLRDFQRVGPSKLLSRPIEISEPFDELGKIEFRGGRYHAGLMGNYGPGQPNCEPGEVEEPCRSPSTDSSQ